MATTYTRKQKDKFGDVWLRDKYGGWTNQYGVRFTKTEHRRFGYLIRKANKEIEKYLEKYPPIKELKSNDIGHRFRKEDLGRFRRRASYKNYLKVTLRIISGYQLDVKMPNNFRNNYIQGLSNDTLKLLAKNSPDLKKLISEAKKLINSLNSDQLIRLSHDPEAPEIYGHYTPIYDVAKTNLETLIKEINKIKG